MIMLAIDDVVTHYNALSKQIPLVPLRAERDYNKAVNVLNQLLDAGGMNEKHQLSGLVSLLGELIGDYEDARRSPDNLSGSQMLRFFMDQHKLKQGDLPEVGSQGVVSEIISGKRELNLRQIHALADRFGVSAKVFV